MEINELCKHHNVDVTNIPKGILEIDIGDKFIKDYDKVSQENNKIIFKGITGQNKSTNTLTIDLVKKIVEPVMKIQESYEEITKEQALELLTTPIVTNNISNEKWTYTVTYNAFGGELTRT